MKSCRKSLFLDLLFISYGFLELSNIHRVDFFNFIFNFGNRKKSGGDKSGEYRGWLNGCNIFWDQTLATAAL
jgi:hypothetical protein